MSKNVIRDILIIAGIAVLALATSRDAMEYISDKREESDAWWGAHTSSNGDLVHMSYLDMVKKFCSVRDYAFTKAATIDSPKVNLYVLGDSYLFKVPDSAYEGVHNYRFAWRNKTDLPYNLDTTKRNVLIIEVAERYVRAYFRDLNIYEHVYDSVKKANATAYTLPVRQLVQYTAFNWGIDMEKLFNPNINQNLEYNLFNYNFINPIMQVKAFFNYRVFDRASGDVVIAADRQSLFLKETMLPVGWPSSYAPLTDDELSFMVGNINSIYDHYKSDGFDKVYLSLIPNAATIMQPQGYNGLIPRLQQHHHLRMPVIDMYTPFSRTKEQLYRPGDTHWNNKGIQMWLRTVNDTLLKCNER